VVVDNFDLMGIFFKPEEADTPLVIDPNTILPSAVAFEGFKVIAGRVSQVCQPSGGVKHSELSARNGEYVCRKALGGLA